MKITRRNFLNNLLQGGVFALVASALYPVVRYLNPPRGSERSVNSVAAGKVGELAPNSAKIFRFGNQAGILICTPQGDSRAFSAMCTHLNCTVQYDKSASIILCACHNGKYDLNGQVISGPPPRPLDQYRVDVQGEDIIVSKNV